MRPEEMRDLLQSARDGSIDVDDALSRLRRVPVEDLDFARLDTHRELRQGLPEVIYAEGKTTEQVIAIAERLLETTTSAVIATRVDPDTARTVEERFPDAVHHDLARATVLRTQEHSPRLGTVAVLCAGTSDLRVAEECSVIAEAVGIAVRRITDVGVAGVHRVLSVQDELHEADVVVVVAGMDGALASLVGGITPAPVVAVPTSVGYGASFEGLSALLTMLNSCAAGITVTNIDNGFGAAMFALRLLRKLHA